MLVFCDCKITKFLLKYLKVGGVFSRRDVFFHDFVEKGLSEMLDFLHFINNCAFLFVLFEDGLKR